MSKNQVAFLQGHGTVLRPFDKTTDLEVCLRWLNDFEIIDLLGTRSMPMTREREAEWFDNLGKNDRTLNLAIAVASSGQLIGSVGLHNIDLVNRIASAGILIGEKAYWGKHHGTNAAMLLLQQAFHRMNLHKVSWESLKSNARSIGCAQRCGFRVEGRRKQHLFRQGQYVDMIELGVFRPQWEAVWRRWIETGSVKE